MDVSTASEGTPLIPKGAISSTGEKREDQTYSSSSSSHDQPQLLAPGKRIYLLVIGILLGAVIYLLRYIYYSRNPIFLPPKTYVYSQPFSTVNPEELDGIMGVNRPLVSRPGNIFARLFANRVLLPTNSWAESLLIGDASYRQESNRVFQIPYIIDTAGYIYGVRAHAAHVQANDRQV